MKRIIAVIYLLINFIAFGWGEFTLGTERRYDEKFEFSINSAYRIQFRYLDDAFPDEWFTEEVDGDGYTWLKDEYKDEYDFYYFENQDDAYAKSGDTSNPVIKSGNTSEYLYMGRNYDYENDVYTEQYYMEIEMIVEKIRREKMGAFDYVYHVYVDTRIKLFSSIDSVDINNRLDDINGSPEYDNMALQTLYDVTFQLGTPKDGKPPTLEGNTSTPGKQLKEVCLIKKRDEGSGFLIVGLNKNGQGSKVSVSLAAEIMKTHELEIVTRNDGYVTLDVDLSPNLRLGSGVAGETIGHEIGEAHNYYPAIVAVRGSLEALVEVKIDGKYINQIENVILTLDEDGDGHGDGTGNEPPSKVVTLSLKEDEEEIVLRNQVSTAQYVPDGATNARSYEGKGEKVYTIHGTGKIGEDAEPGIYSGVFYIDFNYEY